MQQLLTRINRAVEYRQALLLLLVKWTVIHLLWLQVVSHLLT